MIEINDTDDDERIGYNEQTTAPEALPRGFSDREDYDNGDKDDEIAVGETLTNAQVVQQKFDRAEENGEILVIDWLLHRSIQDPNLATRSSRKCLYTSSRLGAPERRPARLLAQKLLHINEDRLTYRTPNAVQFRIGIFNEKYRFIPQFRWIPVMGQNIIETINRRKISNR